MCLYLYVDKYVDKYVDNNNITSFSDIKRTRFKRAAFVYRVVNKVVAV